MNMPSEVRLLYRVEPNCTLVLAVDAAREGTYRWQRCPAETIDWQDRDGDTDHILILQRSELEHGDRWRCLISVEGELQYYSRSLLISENICREINTVRR